MTRFRLAAVALLAAASVAPAADPVPADHAAKMAAARELFKEKVRPFLVANCLECHGGAKTKSGFSMATREGLLKGGDRGPVVQLGKGRGSPLVRFVAREDEPHMPPKAPAPKEAVELLAKWIDLGAAYDKPLVESADVAAKKPLVVTEKDRDYWAYRPLQKVAPPAVRDAAWPRNPIDRFLLAKMEAAGVAPAADADRRTLIRRVTFDLTGLPPTPEEVEAFVNDTSPTAYEKVVDRLLASSAYGERWARHWLDPARYGESHGFEHDYHRPFAYHYRDFVIKALNADMPYDRFVRWQVAGDELAPDDPLALAATGFLGAGVYPTQITNREAERVRYDAMDDMLATTGHAVLALTVGCARCHDHKYDPIPTRDYYRMLAAFTTTVRSEVEVDLGTPEEKKATADFEAKLKPFTDELKRYEQKELPEKLTAWVAERKEKEEGPPKVADVKAAAVLKMLWGGKQTFDRLPDTHKEAVSKWFAPQDAGWKERKAKVTDLEKERPKNTKTKIQATTEGLRPMRHHTATADIPDFYPETYFLNRGDPSQKDGPAAPGFLQVLSRSAEGEKHWTAAKPAGARTSFRRTTLANWLTDTDAGAGALAARVIANRLWHHHFGRGIVATLNDFGFQGDPPTHPELLEWLASDLVSHGWALKRLHKRIVTSRAYQLSGATTPTGAKLDPDNKLWWHRPRKRLEAEAIRDNLLAVAGVLDRTMYGPGTLDQGMKRRSIYFQVQRSQLIPMLQVFDWPDTLTSAAARPTTVVAPQALVFLNSPHVRGWAAAFAGRVRPAAEKGLPAVVDAAYRTAFGRPPTADETDAGVAFLTERGATAGKLDRAISEFALAVVSLNEFIYVE
jgi:mono/diheme cytochrome c family protein